VPPQSQPFAPQYVQNFQQAPLRPPFVPTYQNDFNRFAPPQFVSPSRPVLQQQPQQLFSQAPQQQQQPQQQQNLQPRQSQTIPNRVVPSQAPQTTSVAPRGFLNNQGNLPVRYSPFSGGVVPNVRSNAFPYGNQFYPHGGLQTGFGAPRFGGRPFGGAPQFVGGFPPSSLPQQSGAPTSTGGAPAATGSESNWENYKLENTQIIKNNLFFKWREKKSPDFFIY